MYGKDMMGVAVAVIAFIAVVIGGNLVCAQVPSEGRAKSAIENIGMRNVHVTGRAPAFGVLGGCHENDLTKFTVVGTDASGQQRTLEVCAPLIGGYTIRN